MSNLDISHSQLPDFCKAYYQTNGIHFSSLCTLSTNAPWLHHICAITDYELIVSYNKKSIHIIKLDNIGNIEMASKLNKLTGCVMSVVKIEMRNNASFKLLLAHTDPYWKLFYFLKKCIKTSLMRSGMGITKTVVLKIETIQLFEDLSVNLVKPLDAVQMAAVGNIIAELAIDAMGNIACKREFWSRGIYQNLIKHMDYCVDVILSFETPRLTSTVSIIDQQIQALKTRGKMIPPLKSKYKIIHQEYNEIAIKYLCRILSLFVSVLMDASKFIKISLKSLVEMLIICANVKSSSDEYLQVQHRCVAVFAVLWLQISNHEKQQILQVLEMSNVDGMVESCLDFITLCRVYNNEMIPKSVQLHLYQICIFLEQALPFSRLNLTINQRFRFNTAIMEYVDKTFEKISERWKEANVF